MLCIVIKGPTFKEAYRQLSEAMLWANLVELRLDCFSSLNGDLLKEMRKHFAIPMIFTLRSQRQGGNYTRNEKERLLIIRQLLTLNPEYFDLEYDTSSDFIKEVKALYPKTKLIVSYHDFEKTPENLDTIYQKMQLSSAEYYKIAVKANSSLDALRLICWAKNYNRQLIAISMGLEGQVSRILSPIVGRPFTYASLYEDTKAIERQLTAKTLIGQYHYHSLSPNSKVYGLIGDPVDQSISDETHNHLITKWDLNAVYIKMTISQSELKEFLKYAKQLPFQGISVTMPLKEYILPLLDKIESPAAEMGAVNTLLLKEGKIIGFNTDGIGALNVIEKNNFHEKKRLLIIGAGGAAKAIAYEAVARGYQVTILNRDVKKAAQMAKRLSCEGQGLGHMANCCKDGYDILINCTSVHLPINPEHILPKTIVMDIKTKPKETSFLQYAVNKECTPIYGYEMFIEQALGQFNIWFPKHLSSEKGRDILEKKAIETLLQ